MHDQAFATRPYETGWHRPDGELIKEAIRTAHSAKPVRSALTALSDHAVIVLASLTVAAASGAARGILHPLVASAAALATARAQRGLEVLVHEASHGNLARANRGLNDCLGNVLAGWAVGLTVSDYRAGHSLHHRYFATERDPDRARYMALDVEDLNRGTRCSYVSGVLRRLPGYSLSWWAAVGSSPRCLWRILSVTAALQVLPAYLLGGRGAAVATGGLALVGLLLVTPVVRFLGETSEHQYLRALTVLDTTVSNVGPLQRLLIHPHGDGWHQLHHVLPGVPHHTLRELHHQLLQLDSDGYGASFRYRLRVRQEPVRLPVLERVA